MRVAFTANGKCQILGEIFSKEKRREDKNSFNHSFFFFFQLYWVSLIYRITLNTFTKEGKKRHLYPKGQGRTGPKDPSEVPPEKVKRAKKDFKKP